MAKSKYYPMTTWWLGQRNREFFCCRYWRAGRSDLSEEFVVTSQQLKEELQESRGVDQIFIPQKNQRFAEGLTGNTQKKTFQYRQSCVLQVRSVA